ncbi:MAG TPA: hypothetical protein VFK68_07575 [Propionibacteriaceae bacterium]|nr:hypothetical protein [Propionibacteriaceae bacterium]
MTTDQVVAALAAEGHDRAKVVGVITSFEGIPWREGEGWNEREVALLRRQLGAPENPPDLSFDLDVWAADLAYVMERATGGRARLGLDVLRDVAFELLHQPADGQWLPEASKARLNEHGEVAGLYDPDFTIGRWAVDLGEAIRRGSRGRVELGQPELLVAANLLLHAHEGDWCPRAAQICREYMPGQRTY